MKILSVNIFDIVKLSKLVDNNEYLESVLEFTDGYWHINSENTTEIEWLLNKNRIRLKIKEI